MGLMKIVKMIELCVCVSVCGKVMVEIPRVRWDDIGGYEEIKQQLQQLVEWPIKVHHFCFFFFLIHFLYFLLSHSLTFSLSLSLSLSLSNTRSITHTVIFCHFVSFICYFVCVILFTFICVFQYADKFSRLGIKPPQGFNCFQFICSF
jgi:hypothetical protein